MPRLHTFEFSGARFVTQQAIVFNIVYTFQLQNTDQRCSQKTDCGNRTQKDSDGGDTHDFNKYQLQDLRKELQKYNVRLMSATPKKESLGD